MSQNLKKRNPVSFRGKRELNAPRRGAAIPDWEEPAPAEREERSLKSTLSILRVRTRRKIRHIQRRWRHIVREEKKHNFPESERAPIQLVLFAWNMLPIYPLDGGRALRLLLRENCTWAEWLLLLPAAFLLGLLLHRLGLPFWWASLTIPEKLLANFRKSGYNRGNTEMR